MRGMYVCVCLRKEGSEGVFVYTPYTRKLLKLFSATAGVLISKRKIHKSLPRQGRDWQFRLLMLWVTSDRPCVTQPMPIRSDLQQLVSFFFPPYLPLEITYLSLSYFHCQSSLSKEGQLICDSGVLYLRGPAFHFPLGAYTEAVVQSLSPGYILNMCKAHCS